MQSCCCQWLIAAICVLLWFPCAGAGSCLGSPPCYVAPAVANTTATTALWLCWSWPCSTMLVMLVASTAGWLFVYIYFICWASLSSLLLLPFTLIGHACAACCHRVKPLVDCPFFMNWSLLASLLFSILCCHCHHWPSIACLCCLLFLSLPVDCPFFKVFIIFIVVFALSKSPLVIIVAAILIETAALIATIIVTCCCGHSCVLLWLVSTCVFVHHQQGTGFLLHFMYTCTTIVHVGYYILQSQNDLHQHLSGTNGYTWVCQKDRYHLNL